MSLHRSHGPDGGGRERGREAMEELLDELVRALIREGGQATLDRLLHVSSRLRQAGRDRVLEAARMSGEIEVLEEELYAYHPDPHRYIVLRLGRRNLKRHDNTWGSWVDYPPTGAAGSAPRRQREVIGE